MLLLVAALANAPAEPLSVEAELAMKADALVNLPRYVEWPEGAFVLEKTPLMLGVYGDSGWSRRIASAVNGKLINGRRVIVRSFRWPQVPNSHVLFIARSERRRAGWIITKVKYSPTLTVADFDGFLTQGGILRMCIKDEKVRFHVNTTTAKNAGLRISSKLLAIAEEIVGDPDTSTARRP